MSLTMKPSRLLLFLAVAVFTLLQGTFSSRAYELEGQSWPKGNIVMYLQLGTGRINLYDGTNSWNQVGINAANDWNPYLGRVQFTYVTDGGGIADGDNKNSVFFSSTIFGSSFGNGVLAVTTMSYEGSKMVETDVVVNTDISWNSYRGDLRPDPFSNDYIFDLRRVLDHEFGHVLGLDHPDDFGQNVEAIMNSVISDLDHIAQDDINGVAALYAGDSRGPSLAIDQPGNGAAFPQPSVFFSGSASDSGLGDSGIQSVTINQVSADGGSAGGGNTAFWSLQLGLNLGQNTFNVVATDTEGNSTSRTIVVSYLPPPTISGDTLVATAGQDFLYQINATSTANTFSASGLPAGLSIDPGSGLISGQPQVAGSFTITVTVQNATGAASTDISLTVSQLSQSLTAFGVIPAQTLLQPTFTIESPTSSSGLPVAVTVVSGPATISGNTITATGEGTITLAANQPGDVTYTPATELTTSFVVTKAAQTVTFATIPDKGTKSPPFTISAISDSGLKVGYALVSGPATLSGNTITLTGISGTVVVRARQGGNTIYAASDNVLQSFEVKAMAQTITFPALTHVTYGVAPVTLKATSSAKLQITYTVISGPGVISGNRVKVTGGGTIVIRASQAGNGTYRAASNVSQSLIVNKANQTITFPTVTGAVYGGTLTLAAKSSSGLPIVYTVYSGKGTISGNKVTFEGAGKIALAANQAGNESYNAARQFILTVPVAKAPQTIGAMKTVPAKVYGDAPFFVYWPNANSGLKVVLSVKSGPATISGNKVTLTGAGTVTLAANQPGNANFLPGAETTTTFTVSKAPQTITFGAITPKTVGTIFTLRGTSTSGLAVTYTFSGPATLSGKTITVTGTGTVTVGAHQEGNANYLRAATILQKFTATKAP